MEKDSGQKKRSRGGAVFMFAMGLSACSALSGMMSFSEIVHNDNVCISEEDPALKQQECDPQPETGLLALGVLGSIGGFMGGLLLAAKAEDMMDEERHSRARASQAQNE